MALRVRSHHFVSLLVLAVLVVLLIVPIVSVVRRGFEDAGEFTLYWFRVVLEDPLYREGLVNGLIIAASVTLLSLVLALPLALIADVYEFRGRMLLTAAAQIPLILPPFVGAIGAKGLLSRNGGINALLASWGIIDPGSPIDFMAYPFATCVVLESLYLYPIILLNLMAALANIDPALREAAKDLGAGPIRRLWTIVLPLVRPGAFAGCALVFIWSFTELGTPLMLGIRKLTAVQVFDALQTTRPEGDAYALVVVLMVISVGVYLVGRVLFGGGSDASMSRGTTAVPLRRLSGWRAVLASVPFLVVFVFAVIPHVGVILTSLSRSGIIEANLQWITFEHYAELIRNMTTASESAVGSMAAQSIANSAAYSVLATGIDLVLGLTIAYLVVRHASPLTRLIDSLAMLPLAVPGLVMAFGYFAITQTGPLSFLNPLEHSPITILAIAYAIRRLPFLVRACSAGLQQLPQAMEEAAADLGAGKVRTLVRVVIPLLAANLLAGTLLVFSRSMLEVSDSLLLAFDPSSYPMTKAIWALAAIPQDGVQTASALGVVGMILLAVTFGGGTFLLGKRLGALFRI